MKHNFKKFQVPSSKFQTSPNDRKIKINIMPVASSTKGYRADIFSLQYRHFPPKNKKLKTGTKSSHFKVHLQFGQKLLPVIFLFCSSL